MKFARNIGLFVASVAALLCLSGCETLQHASNTDAEVDSKLNTLQQKMALPSGTAPYSDIVKYLDTQYVSLDPVETKQDATRSDNAALKCHIRIATDQPISILEVAQIVTRECKVPVRVTQDALAQISNPGGATAQQQGPSMSTLGAPQQVNGRSNIVPMVGGFGPQTAQSGNYVDSGLIDVNFDGEGDDFLNTVTARLGGVSWKRLENGSIKIYAMDTRTFSISALATDVSELDSNFQSGTTMVNGATASGTGGGTGGSSSGSASGQGSSSTIQSSSVKLKTDLWGDIAKAMKTMAGEGNAAVTPSTGTVTVKGNVDTLDAVESYVKYQNKRLEKAVTFNIKVYSVALSNSDTGGINWGAMYSALAGQYGLSLAGGFTAPAGAVAAGFSVISNSGKPWAGTNAVVAALNQQGRTHLEREQNLPTLNFNAVSTQVGTQQGYIAGEQTTQTANVGSQTSIQMGTINVGFNVSLFPYIQDNNNILVQFNLNLSSLDSIREVDAGTSKAEAPNINLPLNTVQKVKVTPGDTLVLTGINNTDDTSNRTGTGFHWNWLLGGSVSAIRTNTVLVVLITPIMQN